MKNITDNLLKVIGDAELISVSQKPMDLGRNICVGDIGRSHLNIYRQALIGAKAAETPYIALAEDDILYSKSHFEIRPSSMEVFNYDINEWRIYSWTIPPLFSHKGNICVHQLISARDYFVDAMETRFRNNPDESKINLGNWKDPGRHDHLVGDKNRNIERSFASQSSIVFSHEDAFGYLNMGKRKGHGPKQCQYIEGWGRAEDIYKVFRSRNDQ
jgi:hypothetical protein